MAADRRCPAGIDVKPSAGTLWTASFVLLICVAALLRARFMDRGLWTSEAWVANSVLADRLGGMFYYPVWLQTTPPLLLLLVRGAVGLFGPSNCSFRAVPFAFGVLSVAVQAGLSRRIFRAPLAFLCTAILAFSPVAIAYSKELKQYSSDVASATLILFVLWVYLNRADGRAFRHILLAFGILPWLSHPSVLFVPLAVGVLLKAEPKAHDSGVEGPVGRSAKTVRCVCLLILVFVVGALDYVFFVRPNVAPGLVSFWRDGYPEFGSLMNATYFYLKNFVGLGIFFLVGFRETANPLKTVLVALGVPGRVMMLCGVCGVVAWLAARYRHSSRDVSVAAFSCIPVLTLGAVNLLHLYPVGSRRVMLFLLPCVAVGLTLLVERAWEAVGGATSGRHKGQWLVGVGAVAVACGMAIWASRWDITQPQEKEDVEGAVRHVKSEAAETDLVYVHASVVEPAKLYVRMVRWNNAPVIYGDAGWPCCPRAAESRLAGDDNAILQQELAELGRRGRGRTLWLLFTRRKDHWRSNSRNDPGILLSGLRRAGRQHVEEVGFPDVVLYKLPASPVRY